MLCFYLLLYEYLKFGFAVGQEYTKEDEAVERIRHPVG
jgi:hypothetical protein